MTCVADQPPPRSSRNAHAGARGRTGSAQVSVIAAGG
jgi:hypothetical protein